MKHQVIFIAFVGYVLGIIILLSIKAKFGLQGSGIPVVVAAAIPFLMAIWRDYKKSQKPRNDDK